MRFRHYGGALLALALVLTCGIVPARADNYPAKDASGTTWSYCSKLWTGVQYPCHIMMGLFGSQPTALAVDGSGNLGVNVQSSALPTGAATAAKQDTGNTSLGQIVTNTGAARAASGLTAVTGTFSAAGQSSSFTPGAGRAFNVVIVPVSGTPVFSAQIERFPDATAGWVQPTGAGSPVYVFSAAASEQISEPEFGVAYRVNITSISGGSVYVRISQ